MGRQKSTGVEITENKSPRAHSAAPASPTSTWVLWFVSMAVYKCVWKKRKAEVPPPPKTTLGTINPSQLSQTPRRRSHTSWLVSSGYYTIGK